MFDGFNFVRVDGSRHTRRASSWDATGGNRDRLLLAEGDACTLLNVDGPGCITHIWMTCHSIYPHYLRTLVLKMYWDGEESPSVLTPLGDFFGVGHAQATNYAALPMVMAPRAGHGLNCYLPMPFGAGARIEVAHEFGSDVRLYYNIDYEVWDRPQGASALARLHAGWRRENPTGGVEEPSQMADTTYKAAGTNLSDADNYLILEAEGQGQYIGCNLNIHTLRRGKGGTNWYGEGDEMIFIDDEGRRWPPTLHGTGTEDYFNTAWSPDEKFYSPFFGLTLSGGHYWTGHYSWYRWHLSDPVRFSRSIRVSIEHGHANRRSDDFSSTAYWYQIEPHKPFGIPPWEQRLPRADFPPLEPPEK
ncbi:MAG: DUF2961 domain-containing protein [Anaerolineae bacterium]|nr:DUF2961 domain-containing protein [Anaerolineae bacterium]